MSQSLWERPVRSPETKNLGLIVDNKPYSNEHLQQVEGKGTKQRYTINQFCGSDWCLEQALIKLHKTLMLPDFCRRRLCGPENLPTLPILKPIPIHRSQNYSKYKYEVQPVGSRNTVRSPPIQLQIDFIAFKLGIKLSQHQDIL